MKITHQNQDHLTVIEVRGEFTADHADVFKKDVVERMEENICDFVLDIGAMEFIDSVGLETLLWLQEQCVDRLGQLRLACVMPHVQTILRLTRLETRFEAYDNVDSAVRSLR